MAGEKLGTSHGSSVCEWAAVFTLVDWGYWKIVPLKAQYTLLGENIVLVSRTKTLRKTNGRPVWLVSYCYSGGSVSHSITPYDCITIMGGRRVTQSRIGNAPLKNVRK